MTTIDWEAITRLVADGVAVKTGDRVSVFFTDVSAMPAVSAFVDHCWARGAFPQVMATIDGFDESALRSADPALLATPPPMEMAAMEWSDVHVSFRAMTSPVVDADPRRIAALRHGRGIISTMRWQRTRWALVRVPAPGWAEAMGVDADRVLREWAQSFAADWAEAAVRMRELCSTLDGARHVVIDDEWGRLELPVEGRRWVAFSGEANWPDGEIATAPVETGVTGTISFPGVFSFAGVRIRDLELEFADGMVVREDAAEGLPFVRLLLDTDSGSRRVGELGIGTNAALSTATGDLLIDEKILGTVHIALGRAYPQCGGVNESALHWDIVKDLRAGGSLHVDDRALIHRGVALPLLTDAAVATAPGPE